MSEWKDLSKKAQLRGFGKEAEDEISTAEKDRLMKIIMCALEIAYNCPHAVAELQALDMDHIKNKKSHPDLRYKPGNLQLIPREQHSKKKGYADYRPLAMSKWMKQFDILFRDGR